ncbi:MAG: tetratricopeptide repeat protein [Candidatus Staskawiczbacteria bacterium]|nr:tetratricopeptide repeat protein [Candidatus Staskawiczbacteria bacterium]
MAKDIVIKEPSFIIDICDRVTKTAIYSLAVLIPIFFLPWTADVLDFNKQTLLIFLVFVAFFSWILQSLISGVFKININKVNFAIGALFLSYVASTIFSISRYGSFWGFAQVTSSSLLSVICFGLLYFLVSNTFSQKEIFNSCKFLGLSVFVVSLFGILQILGLHWAYFDFTRNNNFNTIGSTASLGFFITLLLPFFILFSIFSEGKVKKIFIANIFLSFILLVFINYYLLWILTLIGTSLIIIFWFIKRDVFDGRWMFLPMFFLIISLFFITFNPQISWLPQRALEVSLSQKANLDIDLLALKSDPMLGSGPGTFLYDFARYKTVDLNRTAFWNVNFNVGASKFLTDLSTNGLVGLLVALALMILPIFYVVKWLTQDSFKSETEKLSLVFGLLIVLVLETVGFFLFNSNITLDFIYFFSIASLMALISKNQKTYVLRSSSFLTLIITFAFTLVFIFGLGFLMMDGQRYYANVKYYQALKAFDQGKKDIAIKNLKIAISNNVNSDIYYNNLALFALSKSQDDIAKYNNKTASDEDKKAISTLISDSLTAINIATNLNPRNVDNWVTRGYVCQNLIGVIEGSVDCAITSYDKAIELNSSNPYLYFQKGNAYVSQTNNLPQNQAQSKNEILAKANEQFNKAIDLKKDYSLVYFQMALVAKLQQDSKAELNYLQSASIYSANDAGLALQIGLAYYQENNLEMAKSEFKRALVLVPDYANALYYLGLTYDGQGQKDNALNQFMKLLALNPDNKNVQKIVDNLKAGRSALESTVKQSPAPIPPATDPDTTVKKKPIK